MEEDEVTSVVTTRKIRSLLIKIMLQTFSHQLIILALVRTKCLNPVKRQMLFRRFAHVEKQWQPAGVYSYTAKYRPALAVPSTYS